MNEHGNEHGRGKRLNCSFANECLSPRRIVFLSSSHCLFLRLTLPLRQIPSSSRGENGEHQRDSVGKGQDPQKTQKKPTNKQHVIRNWKKKNKHPTNEKWKKKTVLSERYVNKQQKEKRQKNGIGWHVIRNRTKKESFFFANKTNNYRKRLN